VGALVQSVNRRPLAIDGFDYHPSLFEARMMPRRPGSTICVLVLGIELLLAGFLMIAHDAIPAPAPVLVDIPRVAATGHLSLDTGPSPVPMSPEAQRRALITGEWEDDYQAGREWTLRDDGTGTMVVHLDGVAAFMFGSTLRFEQTWRIEGDRIVMAVTGGEPRSKIDLILKMDGSSAAQRITKLTSERLEVVDEKKKQTFAWRRLPAAQASAGNDTGRRDE